MDYTKIVKCPCDICGLKDFEIIASKVQFNMPYKVAICRKCGLVQINPQPTLEELNSFYESEYTKFYNSPQSVNNKTYRMRGDSLYSFVSRYMKGSEVKEILEIGSGGGGNLVAFIENLKPERTCAIEPGIMNHSSLQKLGIEILGSFYEEKEYELKNCNLIIMSHVLEHFISPMNVLRKLYKESGDDVRMVVLVPSLKHYKQYKPLEKYWFRLAHLYYFTQDTFTQLLNISGWEIIDSFTGNGEIGVQVKKRKTPKSSIENYYASSKSEYEEYKRKVSYVLYYVRAFISRVKKKLATYVKC